MSEQKHLFLIDGYGFLFRAYHSLPPLTNPQGTPVGGVYGFITMLMKLLQKLKSENDHHHYAAVILDAGRETFRHKIDANYKANRPPPPEDLIPQFPLIRDAAEAMNLPAIDLPGYEADDLIATYAKQARAAGYEVTIVSSDKDLMQLVADGICMYDAMKDKRICAPEVLEKFGVSPAQVRDVLALMGDSSDNVPGVPGIGPKTAAELIQQFGSLEKVLENAASIPQKKRSEALQTHRADAELSYQLVGLHDDVPVPTPLSALEIHQPDSARLAKFLALHGFKSLLARLGHAAENAAPSPSIPSALPVVAAVPLPQTYTPGTVITVDTLEKFRAWLERHTPLESGMVALLVEETNEHLALRIATNEKEEILLTVTEQDSIPGDLFSAAPQGAIALADVLKDLARYLALPGVALVGHQLKPFIKKLQRANILPNAIEDITLLSYACDGGLHDHAYAGLMEKYLGMQNALVSASLLLLLYQKLRAQIQAYRVTTVYERIERPLLPVLAKMEQAGVKIDRTKLQALTTDFNTRIAQHAKEIFQLAGEEFNIGSPKQLGEVLFDHMGIQGGKKSKSGAYGTDSGVLEEIAAQGHTIADKVLAWRQLSKLVSTYTEALQKEINAKTGRVHTTFEMALTTTGRLSSNQPNLQNIPIRTEEGKKIRTAFIAEPGHKLISADYSQIELRLLAHMATIAPLREAFKQGLDVHTITASQVFGIPIEHVDSARRRQAKAINFGIIYGQSAHGLAMNLGISRTDAAKYIEAYFAQYPGIQTYMEKTKEFAREHGYVRSLYGRRCYVPFINDKIPARRQFAERAAINAPLQGTAADIIKKAMIALDGKLAQKKYASRLILQIHDELLIEAPENEAEEIATLTRKTMEQVAYLSVPLTTDVKIVTHWGEA